MSERTTRNAPHQDRSSDSITHILDTAETAFDSRGYAATTMAAIAEAAGVSVGRIYYWFETKDAIARGLAERNEQFVVEIFAALLVDNEDMSTPDLLTLIVARTLEAARAHPSVLLQLDTPMVADDPTGASQLAAVVHHGVAELVAGRVPNTSDAEARIVAATIINTVIAGARTIASSDAGTAEALSTELVYLLSAYLACRFPATDNPSKVVAPARPAGETVTLPQAPLNPYTP